ncbi:hypothetical protein AX14_012514 [Amanita brunnescens Koide BX004]|nr:hypothetical protein AX14_012514 [Amanita brunnescens Koide BX004]
MKSQLTSLASVGSCSTRPSSDMQSFHPVRQGPGKMSDPTRFRWNQQKNAWILGGVAAASVMGVLYMINKRDVKQSAPPASKGDAGTK